MQEVGGATVRSPSLYAPSLNQLLSEKNKIVTASAWYIVVVHIVYTYILYSVHIANSTTNQYLPLSQAQW